MKNENISAESLFLRLERLETQNRRIKQLGLLILLLTGSIFLMAQAKPAARVLEAGKFVLRSAKGTKRAELGTQLDGPALVIYDEKERAVLSLGILEEGPELVFWNGEGKKTASLLASSSGPVLSFGDAHGVKRLNLSVGDLGPAIGLLGARGEAKTAIGLTGQDNPFLHLFGGKEHGGTQLLAAPDMAVLRFLDSQDKPRAVFGMLEKENAPGITLNDDAGTARAVLMLLPKGASLDFMDDKRSVLWHAP